MDVSNRLQALQDINGNNFANSMYNNIKEAHKKVSEAHLLLKPMCKQRVPWESENVAEMRKDLKLELSSRCANPSQVNIEKV